MPIVLLGVAFLVFGAASMWDSHRITMAERSRGVFDLIGPDYYLLTIGVLLIVMAFFLVFQGAAQMRAQRAGGAVSAGEPDAGLGWRHLWLAITLFAYVLLIPLIGYPIATFLLFFSLFTVMGVERWTTIVLSSLVLAVVFFVVFVIFADMPFPKGLLNIGW